MTIHLKGIQKVYTSGFQAVNSLDLSVGEGEFFTLLGPSGCGKTTTLRMIAGLETNSAGTIHIGERDFTHTHPRDRDVAMVFQSYALYPNMTVRANLALNLEVKGRPKVEIAQRVAEVAAMLKIDQLLDRKPGQLSGGQRQRVALGRALIRRPNVFLMDEPLSNLDLKLREHTRTELKRLHEQLKVTTVYVTHDQAEALVLSDRIGIMNNGDLLQVGTPQEIYDRPADTFVAKFVGTPSINLIAVDAAVEANRLRLCFRGTGQELVGASLAASPELLAQVMEARRELVLGVRPESVDVSHERVAAGLPGGIEIIEPMGSVNHLVLRVDGIPRLAVDDDPFVAVVRSNEPFRQGAPTTINIRPDRLVLFDRGTGKTLAVLGDDRSWRRI